MKYTFSLFLFALVMFSVSAQAQLQKINTIAGNGSSGFGGDGGPGVAATLFGPLGVAIDSAGDVFIEDYFNKRVRRIETRTGILTTVAGTGAGGFTGDHSYGASAQLNVWGLALDRHGNLFISDGVYGVVRRVDKATNIITTVVGTGTTGYSGDGGSATAATLQGNKGIAIDTAGNMYIVDAGNNVIRMVDPSGIISTIVGTGAYGYAGDGAAATAALLDSPTNVAVDNMGRLYITDYANNVIRMVDTGIISTVAGNNALVPGYTGDNGMASAAQLNGPRGIATDIYGNLYIADANNNVIRQVDTSGVIRTVIGIGTPGFGGDLGYVNGANLFNPYDVAVDYKGHIVIADANNERVRETYYTTEGVNHVAQSASIEASPNPFQNQVSVSGLSKADRVCILDVAGRQVSDEFTANADGDNTFTIEGLAAGVYMLRVADEAGNRKATVKLVKE